ncbi:serine hydrolase [Phytoactinopolyspora limicola]|uniref:serine hydrolase n=1 Tax=Phytoactinopolyspora limicola TaxID=2715536 RepID=UPI00140B3CB2|nr:serine hydrolase [Phytoactinopolyspora limicola]
MSVHTDPGVTTRLENTFADAGVTGYLHAVDIDSGAEVGLAPDTPVVTASVFKIYILLELCCRSAEGSLGLTDRIRIPAGDRSLGPTGLSVMLDDTELSLRDAAYLMMSVSDNHATDVLMDFLGVQAINDRLRTLGLEQTVAMYSCDALFRTMAEDLTGSDDVGQLLSMLSDVPDEKLLGLRALDPEQTDRSTPRETTALLTELWRPRTLPEEACAEARRIMGLQVWPHRLTSGFPDDTITVSGKTGTLSHVRNEVGVVEYPDGGRYAVAVYLRLPGREFRNPVADAVIGRAARLAVDHLRGEA